MCYITLEAREACRENIVAYRAHLQVTNKTKCGEYAGSIFTTFYFLRNLKMGSKCYITLEPGEACRENTVAYRAHL